MHFSSWLLWFGYPLEVTSGRTNQEVLSFPSTHSSHTPLLRNYAASMPSKKAQFEVVAVPFPKCGEDELIIKSHVIAVNPVDWKIQTSDRFNLTYPAILGEDVAGEVLVVGSKVGNGFQVGQRVMAYTLGLSEGSSYGGFQLYPVLKAATTSPIPHGKNFDAFPYSCFRLVH